MGVEERAFGEVFTQRWVVDLILELVGYRSSADLTKSALLDPACGDGAFLIPAVTRLLESAERHGVPVEALSECVRAYDLQVQHVESSRAAVEALLIDAEVDATLARSLATTWVDQADFLLLDHPTEVDFVVGNPPYIRYDEVEPDLMAEYRAACPTMSGRGDVYVGFYEMGLEALRSGGRLGFICADRWMKNAYGKRLRQLVQSRYAVETVVEMHDVDAFAEQVSAYPAITVLSTSVEREPVVVSTTSNFGAAQAGELVGWMDGARRKRTMNLSDGSGAARLRAWFDSDGFWPTGSPDRLALINDLESRFAPLEAGSTKVGIGVATGADRVFITTDPDLVEQDRLVPMLTTKDIATGRIDWGGHHLVNPWAKPRTLVNLEEYPRLRAHFESAGEQLRKRHVAKKDRETWYRTIDPVHEHLTAKPKLLFPDMKLESRPVFDPGGFYPHHNLYYITSEEWDLETLGGLLSSRAAQAFIEAYGVKMRGGTLRYQAQYLRRIHVPAPDELDAELAAGLKKAFQERDFETVDQIALDAFQITEVPD